MTIKIKIEDCTDCPFHDTEWGCNLNDLNIYDCPFDNNGGNKVIIKDERGDKK